MKLITFPDKKNKDSQEIKLLKRFIDVSVIQDEDEYVEEYRKLREAIYDFLPDYLV